MSLLATRDPQLHPLPWGEEVPAGGVQGAPSDETRPDPDFMPFLSDEELTSHANRVRSGRRALRYFDQVEWDAD